ncbi:MAG: nitronate monooxygenase [Gammaproteobacteria bacterium]
MTTSSKLSHTVLCDRLGIDVAIVQAPIGSATTPELAAAVANAGGLGMLSVSWRSPQQIASLLAATRVLTSRPVGVNVVLEWPQRERVALALEKGVRIISTFWGDPAPYVSLVHDAGGLLLHTVGSLDEARRAVAAGVDVLVAQGVEAGGHVCGSVPLCDLLADVIAGCPGVPVLAAGGIADGTDVAAALAAGACGVWMGTRFVCASEANAADIYKDRIVASGAADTVLTSVFDQGWPDAPHRVLMNSTFQMSDGSSSAVGPRAGAEDIIATSARGTPVRRYAFALPTRELSGDLEAMALYAGTSTERIHDVQPADRLIERLVRETDEALHSLRT